MLDGTVVNVALPAIGEDFGAGVAGLQWVVTAYLLTLASLILLGGSLGDRFGRRRVFRIGVVWFTVASVGCAVAPSLGVLVAARAIQGVGGALLVPGSLAMIEATFHPDDRGRAIGAWSGLGGVASALGPFLGGYLVTAASWRLVFLINLPLAAAVLVAVRHVPESRNPAARQAHRRPRRDRRRDRAGRVDLRPDRSRERGHTGGDRDRPGRRRRARRLRRDRTLHGRPDAAARPLLLPPVHGGQHRDGPRLRRARRRVLPAHRRPAAGARLLAAGGWRLAVPGDGDHARCSRPAPARWRPASDRACR